MMSVHRFRREALLYYYRKKSPMIQDIETLLKEYHRTDSENKKMKCLVYIYLMCKHYLSTKALGKRRDGIQTLLEETKQILDSPGFMTKIQNKARGLHYSSGYKTRITSTTNSFKTLEPTYQIEGILPQKNFVDKMNLHWEQFLDAPKYLGANDLTFEVRVENDRQYLLDWTQSTVTDALDVYYENWTKGYDRQFVYLNAEQRQQYLMRVGAGRIYNYLTNTPFAGETSLISPGSMYVMDTDERLYIFNGKATNYNHSSFLSGHPVICAGTIWVINGRIHRITNNSGHYKPSKKDLAACIRVILNSYIDQNFEVIVIPGEVTYPTAQDFLATIPIQ